MSEFQKWTSQHRTIRAARDWNALLDHGLEKPASYIIRKNGSYVEAINGSTGKIDYGGVNNAGGVSGSDASAVIQQTLNSMKEYDSLVVKCDIELTNTLVISERHLTIRFLGNITADGVDAIHLGTAESGAGWTYLYLVHLDGVSKSADGIVVDNARHSQVYFNIIRRCRRGIYFSGLVEGGENRFYGGEISGCVNNIEFAASSNWMQGNMFVASSFSGDDSCLKIPSGSNAKFTMFIGVLDNCIGTYTLFDEVGYNIMICYYFKWDNSVFPESTKILDAAYYGGLNLGVPKTGAHKGISFDTTAGAIELWNGDTGLTYIDFKSDYSVDRDARIAKPSDHSILVQVGGSGSLVDGLKIDPNGRNIPLIFKLPTSAPASPQAGDAYFDTTTAVPADPSKWQPCNHKDHCRRIHSYNLLKKEEKFIWLRRNLL